MNISVAIIPMAAAFGWSPTVAGLVQSSFFWGYMASQIPGGYVNSRFGGRTILPLGVGLWSGATAAVPVLAGTIPGVCNCAHLGFEGMCPNRVLYFAVERGPLVRRHRISGYAGVQHCWCVPAAGVRRAQLQSARQCCARHYSMGSGHSGIGDRLSHLAAVVEGLVRLYSNIASYHPHSKFQKLSIL